MHSCVSRWSESSVGCVDQRGEPALSVLIYFRIIYFIYYVLQSARIDEAFKSQESDYTVCRHLGVKNRENLNRQKKR